ncbi:hypothetical protein TSUD_425360, partial [Trifolium subterraneum]
MPVEEITVTLDDVSCLLHLPLKGHLLDHSSISKADGIDLMVNLLGSESDDALLEVTKTKCAHAKTTYVKRPFRHHIKCFAHFTVLGDEETYEIH